MALLDRRQYGDVEAIRVGWLHRRRDTSCYFFRIGSTLIDTGPPNQRRVVTAALRGRFLQQILLTHHHEDHCGNAAVLQKIYDTPVYVHRHAVKICETGFKMPLYRRLVWGTPQWFKARPYEGIIDGENGLTFVPIPTPGHSADLVCLLEPQRGWLFSGDLFLTTRPRYARREENPLVEINSLRKLLQFDIKILFCAHRGAVQQPTAKIRQKMEYLEGLREKVVSRRRRGQSIAQITVELLGKEGFLSLFSGFDFCKRNLIAALAANTSHDNR